MNTVIQRVDYSEHFLKLVKKAPLEIKRAFQKRLLLFIASPFHPLLRNHTLTGEYAGLRSINVTGDWRALYSEEEEGIIIVFELLGTHSQLYR